MEEADFRNQAMWAGDIVKSIKCCPEFRFQALTLRGKKLGVVSHSCDPSTGETEIGGFLELTG